ncbi:MAG: tetratricopeptide repeat protein [Candidatus Brocadiales bacterium]
MTRILIILLITFFLLSQNGFSQEEINYHNTLALTLAKKGMLDEAVSRWKKVIEMSPPLAIPHYNLGLVYHKKGMLEEAISEYKRAVELDEDYTLAHYNLGNAYYQKGLHEQALSQWQMVLKLDPNDEAAKNNIEVVQSLLAKRPSPTAQVSKGQQEGERPEVSASSTDAQENFDKGIESLRERKVDDAIKFLKEVVRIDPNFPKAYTELGRAYHRKRMLAEAMAAYRKALALDPNDKRAKFLLSRIRLE